MIRAVRLLALAAFAAALAASSSPSAAPRSPHAERHPVPGSAIPDGTTVFDRRVAGVTRLDPALRAALRRASADAGIAFVVESGWRSPAYQQRLLSEAVAKYGSEAEAARWVAPPARSAHVSGDAVDLASAAANWLSVHGAAYGLCQVYANEPWHFELRRAAFHQGCPPVYADPTQDPRMH